MHKIGFRTTRNAVSVLVASLVLAGCSSLAPTLQKSEDVIPEGWTQVAAHSASPSAASTMTWEQFVVDPALRELVTAALRSNRDLRQALLNVEVARAMYRVERSDRLPSISADASGNRQRVPQDLRTPGTPEVQSAYQAGIGLASFEVDLFGRVRSLSEVALNEYLATEEAARAARVSLIAEVVQAYLMRSSAEQRHLVAARTKKTREISLGLIEDKWRLGASTELEVFEARLLHQQIDAELQRTSREFRQANNALRLLVGEDIDTAGIPPLRELDQVVVQDISPGVPSELLASRPDVRAAERVLQARNANIGAARAAFFPRIVLTGFAGSASSELSELFSSGQRAWSFIPSITLPIFDGGRNQANLDVAVARKEISIARYELSIQTAFREVSDALVAAETYRREEQVQRSVIQTSSNVLRLAKARYEAGADDHLRYLDAQRSDLAAQMSLIQVQTQRQLALAMLFKTLGGGWQDTPAGGSRVEDGQMHGNV